MVYMGSKRKYAKYIAPIINKYIVENNINIFVDCFVGGANLADKIECKTVIGNDLSPSLIALHEQAQKDFSKIPEEGSREYWDNAYAEWKRMKSEMVDSELPASFNPKIPLYEIGAIEWYGSFSNGGFPRGYAKPSAARDYYKEAYRNHQKQTLEQKYKDIYFIQGDYRDLPEMVAEATMDGVWYGANVLFYCDSPYKGTKPYAIDSKFNFEAYYEWLRETSAEFPIFVSEQALPEEFDKYIVWTKDDAKRTNGLDNNFKACEKLYLIDRRESNA